VTARAVRSARRHPGPVPAAIVRRAARHRPGRCRAGTGPASRGRTRGQGASEAADGRTHYRTPRRPRPPGEARQDVDGVLDPEGERGHAPRSQPGGRAGSGTGHPRRPGSGQGRRSRATHRRGQEESDLGSGRDRSLGADGLPDEVRLRCHGVAADGSRGTTAHGAMWSASSSAHRLEVRRGPDGMQREHGSMMHAPPVDTCAIPAARPTSPSRSGRAVTRRRSTRGPARRDPRHGGWPVERGFLPWMPSAWPSRPSRSTWRPPIGWRA